MSTLTNMVVSVQNQIGSELNVNKISIFSCLLSVSHSSAHVCEDGIQLPDCKHYVSHSLPI